MPLDSYHARGLCTAVTRRLRSPSTEDVMIELRPENLAGGPGVRVTIEDVALGELPFAVGTAYTVALRPADSEPPGPRDQAQDQADVDRYIRTGLRPGQARAQGRRKGPAAEARGKRVRRSIR